MSSGAFRKTKYESNITKGGGGTYTLPIRIQPETASCTINAVANSAPTNAIDLPISAVVSRGRRSKGVLPRTVTLQNTDTAGTGGYKAGGVITIPALNKDFFDAAAAATDTTPVNYLSRTTWKVSYVTDERVR
jgi:hypothetical protein